MHVLDVRPQFLSSIFQNKLCIGNFDRPPAGNGLLFPFFSDKARKSPHLPHSRDLPPSTWSPQPGFLAKPSQRWVPA